MSFRFRRSVKLMPGIRLNVSKSGISASVGVPGATVNIGRRGVRGTVGLPGTGLSYTETLAKPMPSSAPQSAPAVGKGRVLLVVILCLLVLCVLLKNS